MPYTILMSLVVGAILFCGTSLPASGEKSPSRNQSPDGWRIANTLRRELPGHGFYTRGYLNRACNTLLLKNAETGDDRTHDGQVELPGERSGRATLEPGLYAWKWIARAIQAGKRGEWSLEVGAAIGGATLRALYRGAKVYAMDKEGANLAIIQSKIDREHAYRLRFIEGTFPSALSAIPDNFLDNILIGSVLHLMLPEEIPAALERAIQKLKPGGVLIIENQTPFMPGMRDFLRTYNSAVQAHAFFPGFIPDVGKIFPGKKDLTHLTLFDRATTLRVLEDAGLEVSDRSARYFPRSRFPEELILRRFDEQDPRFVVDLVQGNYFRRYESVGGYGFKPQFWVPRSQRRVDLAAPRSN